MELLAADVLPADEGDNAFVVGMFSLLDTMLGMSMPAVLSSVSLPTNVFNALLHKTGPLAELLKVCIACENGDQRSFAHAVSLGLSSSQINTAHLQALAWAGTINP